MKRPMIAVAIGVVLTMAGCSAPLPTGDALYAEASQRYETFAEAMHVALMAAYEGQWSVGQREHGAAPRFCDTSDEYTFAAIRSATVADIDADAALDEVERALDDLGLDTGRQAFGTGDTEERSVVAQGDGIQRLVVTIRPATGVMRVTGQTTCAPGDAYELSNLVFGESDLKALWRWLPATEGPDWVAQFYFPPDGPLYYTEDGTPWGGKRTYVLRDERGTFHDDHGEAVACGVVCADQ